MTMQAVARVEPLPVPAIRSTFGDVERQPSARIAAVSSLLRKSAGEVLFAEGDGQDAVYEVVRGMLCLYKLMPDGRRQVTGFLSAGQVLDASGPDGLCVSTAEAVTDVAVCRYPRPAFERLIDEVPGFARRLLAMTSQALQTAQDQMLLLGRKVAMEKLASFVLLLADRQRDAAEFATVFVPMTRADIADYLGLTVETVSRTFTRLRRDGLIDLPTPNQVRIQDRERLEELAAGDAASEF